MLEQLIKSGALDGLPGGHHRAQLLAALDAALERGAAEQRDRRSGQTSLFGLLAAAPSAAAPAPGAAKQGETYPRDRACGAPSSCSRSRRRRSASTSRAIRSTATAATSSATRPRRRATSRPVGAGVGEHSIGGIVSQYREMITKKGDKMARFMLEDAEGTLEVIAFPKTFEKVRHVLVSDEPILCTGAVKNEGNAEAPEWKMLLETAAPLSELRQAEDVARRHPPQRRSDDPRHDRRAQDDPRQRGSAATARRCCASRSRSAPRPSIALPDAWAVSPTEDLLTRLERLFGDRVATLA